MSEPLQRVPQMVSSSVAEPVLVPDVGVVFAMLPPAQLAARWRELYEDPSSPDRFELDAYGDIVPMNAPKMPHQRVVLSIQRQLLEQLGGEPLPGLGILTPRGVFIPDVAWSPRFASDEDPQTTAPPLCVEVQSESNTRRELDEKVRAYFAAGSREVVLIELGGRIRHFGPDGETEKSAFGLELTLPEGPYRRD